MSNIEEYSNNWQKAVHSNDSEDRREFHRNFESANGPDGRLVSLDIHDVQALKGDFRSMELKMGLKNGVNGSNGELNFIPALEVVDTSGTSSSHFFDKNPSYANISRSDQVPGMMGHVVPKVFVDDSQITWAALPNHVVFNVFRANRLALLQYDVSSCCNPLLYETFQMVLSVNSSLTLSQLTFHLGIYPKIGNCLKRMPYTFATYLEFKFDTVPDANSFRNGILDLQEAYPLPKDCNYIPPLIEENGSDSGSQSVYYQYLFPCPPHGNCEENE